MKENLSLFDVLIGLTIPSHDDGKQWTNPSRINKIQELLANENYICQNKTSEGEGFGELFSLYSKGSIDKNRVYTVVSTHADSLQTKPFVRRGRGGIIRGTFDNLLTNAVALFNMLSGAFNEDVLVSFNGGEEHFGSIGAAQMINFAEAHELKISAYIVLDVTWERFYGAVYSLENVVLPYEKQEKLLKMLDCLPYSYIFDPEKNFADETWIYKKNSCFFLGAPNLDEKYMHSNRGVRMKETNFIDYTDAVAHIANMWSAGENS